MTFNKNTAPAKYSNVKWYVALYNETIIIDSNVVNTPWIELSRPDGK